MDLLPVKMLKSSSNGDKTFEEIMNYMNNVFLAFKINFKLSRAL